MLTTHRRDQRTRRQAPFTLESLDDRLVLSAAGAGVAAEAVAARHEAKLERVEARHEAKLAARAAAHSLSADPVAIPTKGSAKASAARSASSTASSPVTAATPTPSATTTTSSPVTTTQSAPGPLSANVAAALQSLYTEYGSAGSGSFKPSQPTDSLLQISGNNVEVSIKIGSDTAFSTALSQLQSDGMQVSSSSSTYGLVDGMLPISELPAAAQLASSVNPAHPPIMR
jgi:hypothetical protein